MREVAMKFNDTLRKLALAALVAGAGGTLAGCVVTNPGYGRDPYDSRYDYPPARPYDGYRYAYPGGLSMVYDSQLGLYSIYGHPDYYFYDGYFYRWHGGYWNRSRNWNRDWRRCEPRYWPRPIYYVNDH